MAAFVRLIQVGADWLYVCSSPVALFLEFSQVFCKPRGRLLLPSISATGGVFGGVV